jgi:putative MATE family efflux protein
VVWNAARGHGADPNSGPVGQALITLAVPMVLEMVMESIFAVVDIFFVSRLGSAAAAGVGLTESLITIVYTVALGLSIGVAAIVARRMGEGHPEQAAAAAVQGVTLGVLLALVIGTLGALFAPQLLGLMGADDEVRRIGSGYARVMLGGSGSVLLLFLLNAAFRGAGDAGIAMRVLWLANAINIVLAPCLIFGLGPFPELGVTGAGIATVIGRSTGVAVQLAALARGRGRLRVRRAQLRLEPRIMLGVLRLSATGMLQVFISTASWIGLVRLMAGFGSDAVAGNTIAIRIVLFALLPSWGLANAAATMVGQALGAGNPGRAERAVWLAGLINLAFLGATSVLFIAAAPSIVGAFGADAAALDYAAAGLRIISAGFVFYAFGMVLTQSFNGAGDTWTPTLLNLVCFWLWEIPLAWLLSRGAGLGPAGVFAAVAVAFSTLALLSAAAFRRGRWKERTV